MPTDKQYSNTTMFENILDGKQRADGSNGNTVQLVQSLRRDDDEPSLLQPTADAGLIITPLIAW
jgi:hypothetical protein